MTCEALVLEQQAYVENAPVLAGDSNPDFLARASDSPFALALRAFGHLDLDDEIAARLNNAIFPAFYGACLDTNGRQYQKDLTVSWLQNRILKTMERSGVMDRTRPNWGVAVFFLPDPEDVFCDDLMALSSFVPDDVNGMHPVNDLVFIVLNRLAREYAKTPGVDGVFNAPSDRKVLFHCMKNPELPLREAYSDVLA